MGWLVAIIALVGLTPVLLIMMWAFVKKIIVDESLTLRRRLAEDDDRLFEQFMRDPNRKVVSRTEAADDHFDVIANEALQDGEGRWDTRRRSSSGVSSAPS
jgi:hypothetical protein